MLTPLGSPAWISAADQTEHREYPRPEWGRQAAAESGHQGGPDTEDQRPQQERAFMRAPDRGDSILDRQFEIGIGGDIGNRKILLHKGMDQNQEADGHQRQQGAGGDRRDRHPTLVVAGGANHRHDAQQQSHQQRENQRELADFRSHGWRSAFLALALAIASATSLGMYFSSCLARISSARKCVGSTKAPVAITLCPSRNRSGMMPK